MAIVKVAALQPLLPHEMGASDRLKKQLGLSQQALKAGADYILFPEFFLGMSYVLDLRKGSEEMRVLQSFAEDGRVWLGINTLTLAEEGTNGVYNSVILINPKGEIAAEYRKIRPYAAWEPVSIASLGFKFKMGEGMKVQDTGGLKVGLAQCIDLWVSDFMKELSLRGAELVYVPSRMPLPHFLSTQIFARVRAMENCFYVAVVGEAGRTMPGTFIAGPRLGGMEMDIATIGCDEGFVMKTIDLEWLRRQRSERPPLFRIRNEKDKAAMARANETDWTNRWYEGSSLKDFMDELRRLGLASE
ncbi:MAG: carbon-nitrogen hydrolase family protein [Candidatus Bathyarchaeia archaeon]